MGKITIMKRIRLSIFSTILSSICIVLIIWMNLDIVQKYISTDGKGRALFGIIEIWYLNYKFYLIVISLISIGLSTMATRRKENKYYNLTAYFFGILSLILIFIRFWKIMI